nr:pentatricopeptide repeat-containing protein At1g07740, mitochondrial [Oryza sativa Japonica Group]
MSGVTASRVMVGSPAAALLAFALHCCVREAASTGLMSEPDELRRSEKEAQCNLPMECAPESTTRSPTPSPLAAKKLAVRPDRLEVGGRRKSLDWRSAAGGSLGLVRSSDPLARGIRYRRAAPSSLSPVRRPGLGTWEEGGGGGRREEQGTGAPHLALPSPPLPPRPFLLHLKSLPSPVAAAAALLSAPTRLHDHPFAACVLYRLARARLFPLVPPLLATLHSRGAPLRPSVLAAASRPDAAVLVFRAVPAFCSHSAATFHSLLNALVSNGRADAARDMLQLAPKLGVREGELGAAERLIDEMVRRGVAPNAATYSLLMQGLCDADLHADAEKLMFDMEYRGYQAEVVNYGVLTSSRARRGDVNGVRELLSAMRKRKLKPDDASYNVLIKCPCDVGRVDEAHRALLDMQLKGTVPGAANVPRPRRRVLQGSRLRAGSTGFQRDVGERTLSSTSHLVRGLGEDGKVEEACFVLEQMARREMSLDADGWQAVVTCVRSSRSTQLPSWGMVGVSTFYLRRPLALQYSLMMGSSSLNQMPCRISGQTSSANMWQKDIYPA